MQRYILALAVICLLAIGAILLLRPDPSVEYEAELSHFEPEDALHSLGLSSKQGPMSRNLHLMHARLAMAAGDLASARSAYRQVLSDNIDTPQVLDELADLAALEGKLEEAAMLKARAQRLAPEPERREELGYWLRLIGDRSREIALLQATPTRRLKSFERSRLAELYIANQDVESYRTLLSEIAEFGGEEATDARRRLLELNIEVGNPEAALDLALAWNASDPKDHASLAACLRAFVGRGATAEAMVLAGQAVSTDPDIGPIPVDVFLSAGHGGIGRQLQLRWLASDAELDAEDWQALALNAERTGDLSALSTALARNTDNDAAPPPEVFLQFLRYRGARALLPYADRMTPELFAKMPLLGAAWTGWHRQTPGTFAYLVAASEGLLTDWDRAIWMAIAQDLRGTPFYRELLAGATSDAGILGLLRASVVAPIPMTSLTAEPERPVD